MLIKQKFQVWQDTITGQCYRREWAFRPVVAPNTIDGKQASLTQGYVYSPVELPDSADFNLIQDKVWNFKADAEVGYPAECFGQDLFLTETELQTRFNSLGVITREIDTSEVLAQYTAEHCDFSDLVWVLKSAVLSLGKEEASFSLCIQITLLTNLLHQLKQQNLSATDEQQLATIETILLAKKL